MSLANNIKNAFEVVLKTYENVDKLIKYCDSIAIDFGYEPVTNKFLRYKSDSNYEGWFINSFIKLYQCKKDKVLENEWKDGPVFAMEINFENTPIVYLSKFEYQDISTWGKGVSPTEHWGFTEPIDCEGSGFNERILEGQSQYFISEPSLDIKSRYWNIKRATYTKVDLLEINSNNIDKNIFGQFDILKEIL